MSGSGLQLQRAAAFGLCAATALAVHGAQAADSPTLHLHHEPLISSFKADEFEYRVGDVDDRFHWEAEGWVGGDDHKFWYKARGEQFTTGRDGLEQAELQALYSRRISTFYDAQVGIRYDFAPDPERTFAVFALKGLAPYFFDTDLSGFVSNEGELSLRAEARYDLLLTQRWIVQPKFEVNLSSDDAPARAIGSGFNTLELELRLRYEITRKFAPYVGLSWERRFGETAALVRRDGGDPDVFSLNAGVRFWY